MRGGQRPCSGSQACYKPPKACTRSLMISRRRLPLILLIAAALAIGTVGIYATLIEPRSLRLREITLYFDNLPQEADGLVIAHISDLHMHRVGPRERKILRILEENPADILAITGDQISDRGDSAVCLEFMNDLHARIGVWAVQGNWEHYAHWTGEELRQDMRGVNVTLLINEAQRLGEGGIWIAGTDDPSLEMDRLAETLAGTKGEFILLLAHSPAIMKKASGSVDLILAGHTHGGQVRLPLVGAPWGRRIGGGYNYGIYEQNGTVMYVTRGVGMAHLPIRFLCPPEIAYVTLRRGLG